MKNLVFYSGKDVNYFSDIKSHISLVVRNHGLGSIRYIDLEQRTILLSEMEKYTNEPTCIICLLSPHFLDTELGYGTNLQFLISAHLKRQLLLVPIYLDNTPTYPNPLGKIVRLNANQQALNELLGQHYHHQLSLMAEELKDKIIASAAYHQSIEVNWKKAQTIHSIEGYTTFIDHFLHCKYIRQAKAKRNILIEEKLWTEAQSFDKTSYYLTYLTDAPLQHQRKEAIKKIIAIESSESVIREDAMNNTNLGLLLDYKSKYRHKIDEVEVNDKIFELLSNPLRFTSDEMDLGTEAYLLKHKLFEKSTPNEAFTFDLLEEFAKKLILKITIVKKNLDNKRQNIRFYSLLALLIFCVFILGVKSTIDRHFMNSFFWYLEDHPIRSFILGSAFVSIIILLWREIGRDILVCDKKIKAIESTLIELKLAFIIKDFLGKPILFLHNTEEWIQTLNQRGILYYLNRIFTWKSEKQKETPQEQLATQNVKGITG